MATSRIIGWAAGLLVTAAGSASAADTLMSTDLVRLPKIAVQRPFASMPLSAAALAERRGGEAPASDVQLKGSVTDNTATNVTTGKNVISDGAFAGAAGISTVIQNSGNNVLIQNSTIVNLQLK